LSGYDLEGDAYEDFVGRLLDALRSRGFKKVHLLRPEGNELRADQVVSRKSIDAVIFPYHGSFYLGLTSYVPDTVSLRESGVLKPAPHSEISLSPRLARALVNLTGTSPGQTLLDPFCGSGTILAEGLLRSLRCFGVDSRRRLIEEARLNLRWISQRAHGGSFRLATGDARELHQVLDVKKVDAVATEPILLPALKAKPNVETAKEMIENAGEVYADALASIRDVVKPGGRIVVVVPVVQTTDGNEIYVGLDGRQLGLTLLQPGPISFEYPVRLSFESTRWVKRAVYVFEARS
jgi:tRNA G10  N-methylase Trm11